MDSMIKEINENLRAIIDNLKVTKDNSISTLDNIQLQMDKKVEEAKKYKIQVDSAKEKIKVLEDENKSLEISLNELQDKYGKMNLVSLIEAGNREIKSKINDNLKEINKEKEHIAELTNRARTIKDLLINLKKDKNVKENRLENIKVVYEYYNDRINEIIDYAFDHSENLMDYKTVINYSNYELSEEDSNFDDPIELENTMVFDEIANIDENKNFKDEMTFISDQIDGAVNSEESSVEPSDINEIISKSLSDIDENIEDEEVVEVIPEPIDTTQVFDTILNSDLEIDVEEDDTENSDDEVALVKENVETINEEEKVDVGDRLEKADGSLAEEAPSGVADIKPLDINVADLFKSVESNTYDNLNLNIEEEQNEDKVLDEENEMRINKINDLFSNFENTVKLETSENEVKAVEEKIDDAYMDIFGQPIDADDLNKKEPTLTDIFGNPVQNVELSNDTKTKKKLEELFVENGIDFNKFREDEKNYLKQIYDEDKFNNILNTLKRNKINLDNIYSAFNIFGEISANELESLISKLINVGQSVEAIGLVLEKLPKVKKYNLDEAIMSYGDYIKDIDITELIMKAKELYKNGGNK